MLVLHGGFHQRTFLLWAEEDVEIEGPRTASPGRKPKNPDPKPHPYDPGAEELIDGLGRAGLGPFSEEASTGVLWLPTKGDEPLPSGPLVGEPPPNQAKVRLAPWQVTTLSLGTGEAIELLCRCRDHHTLAPGVVVGDDVAYWASAVRLAGSLVARQKFLPGLVREDGAYVALWEPVLTGDDAETFAALAEKMPPPARAFVGPDAVGPPTTAARDVLGEFLTRSVDRLVRFSGELREPCSPGDLESVHDAWFHALRAEDPVVPWDDADLSELVGHIREWRRPVTVSATSPWRLCFRLEEPAAEPDVDVHPIFRAGDGWRVRYLLQPHDDPSLQVPLEKVWSGDGAALPALERYSGGVREYALSALGEAAGICPFVDESLESAEPWGHELDASGAYRFLSEDAGMLQQAGFGVFLPDWWSSEGTRQQLKARATATPAMRAEGTLGLNSVVEFDWRLALGDHELSREELERLAALKVPLVRVRGEWVEVDPDQIQTALQFWDESETDTATVQDLVEMDLGSTNPAPDIEVDEIEAEGDLRVLLDSLEGEAEFTAYPAPEPFHGELRPYQVRGYSWLRFLRRWGLGGCLADDMGLGKTVQTLALIQHDWHERCRRPTLVVCPTSVVNNWEREAERFTPELPVLVHHGSDREKGESFREEALSQAVIISSYGLLFRDVDFLREIPWAGVVLDEAQNIKNPQTRRARAARSLEADYRLALTGTPVQNHVGDLWSIMEFLNPGLLGSQREFKQRFFVPIQSGSRPDAARRLRRITRPFVLRREKTDSSIISDLPEKMEMKVFCSLTPEQASLYAAVLGDMNRGLDAAEGIQRQGLVLGTLSKLKQVCNHPAHFLDDNSAVPGRSGKLARLKEMLEEVVEMEEQALVFTQFTVMGDLLKEHLQETFGREVLFLHGGVPQKKRARMVDRFQEEGNRLPVFILSLKAGGTGLNLTAANHVFHFDRWWNPAVEDQATDRAFRIGQHRNVEVHKFICAGTVEERIDAMIEKKKEVADRVVGSGESWLTELSDDRLREVFSLGDDAVAE